MTTRMPPSTEGVEELAGLVYGVACWGTGWAALLRLADHRIDVLTRARALAQAAPDGRTDRGGVPTATVRAVLDDALGMAKLSRLLRDDGLD